MPNGDGALTPILGVDGVRSTGRTVLLRRRILAAVSVAVSVAGMVIVTPTIADATSAISSTSPQYAGAPPLVVGATYSQNMPDPTIVFDGSTYWAYTTSTGGPFLPVFSSTDLRTWTVQSDRGHDAFPRRPTWALPTADAQWAPGVIANGSQWLLYSAWSLSSTVRCISVAVASSPAGPFTDSSSGPIMCDDGGGSIDPAPYRAPNGDLYLAWKAEAAPGRTTQIWTQRLAVDGRSLVGTRALLLAPSQSWERGVVENPSMAFVSGSWWLLYSAAAWDSADYRMGVARCDGPLGPCAPTGAGPLLGNSATDLGRGGGSFFTDASGATRIAYHAWNAPYHSYPTNPDCDGNGQCTSQGQRFLRIDTVLAARGTLTTDPIGSFDVASPGFGAVNVAGWAIDPSTPAPIAVHVYVDSTPTGVVAGLWRGDVGSIYPAYGAAHGFNASVPAYPGTHNVCVAAIDGVGGGTNIWLGCRSVTVSGGSPFGSIDAVWTGVGSVSVAGWAIDPDTSSPDVVHVYVDSTPTGVLANSWRGDVGAAFPAYGSAHGFGATVPASGGSHTVCVAAIDVVIPGNNVWLGCRSVWVPTGSPFGSLDAVSGGVGSVNVAGWAIDPDTTASIPIHVYVDSVPTGIGANLWRPDVGAAFPGYGNSHGFGAAVAASPGSHVVCVAMIDVAGSGANTWLGCRAVTVR